MPEGDTIFRTATSLRKWLGQQQVTAATTKVPGLELHRVVGTTITEVTPKAKHLLIRFSNGLVLHTHMRMTGSWHVYRAGEKWQKPQWQAKIVLTCGDRVAVCFNAPVVELLLPSDERRHRSLNGLGPDVLGPEPFDFEEVRKRAARKDGEIEIGVVLLDQQVVSGIGNIYRCEALFANGCNPWKPHSALAPEQLDHLVASAMRLMKQSIEPRGQRHDPWVYGRTNRPCRRCGTAIKKGRIGKQARDVFWCPSCQPL